MPRSAPNRVLPLNDENLLAVLPPARQPREQCAVCTEIGAYVSKREVAGTVEHDSLPPAVGQLREFMRLGENVASCWLESCSECGGLFYAERSYEYLVTGSEDYEAYTAISHAAVLALPEVSWARTPGAELHGFEDGTWSVITEPSKKLPQRRS